jgi:hypothetical protein
LARDRARRQGARRRGRVERRRPRSAMAGMSRDPSNRYPERYPESVSVHGACDGEKR